MKVVILVCIVALSYADPATDLLLTQQQLTNNLVQQEFNFAQKIQNEIQQSILNTLGKRNLFDNLEHEFEKLAPEIINALLKGSVLRREVSDGLLSNINQEIMTFLDKIKESVEGAETIGKNLKANLQTAAQGLKDGQDIKALAQMVLNTLEKDVGSMTQKGTFDVDVNKMIDNIVPSAVSKLLSKHSRRGLLGDLLNGFKDTLTDTVGLLSGTAFGDLKGFLGEIMNTATSAITPTLGNLKSLAEAFLSHAGQATATVAAEAVKFFQPFQNQLGGLFTKIKGVAASLTG